LTPDDTFNRSIEFKKRSPLLTPRGLRVGHIPELTQESDQSSTRMVWECTFTPNDAGGIRRNCNKVNKSLDRAQQEMDSVLP
jgi:hypothetical protein